MEENWILLQSYQNPNEASLVQAMLEENGIQVIALNKRDSAYGLFGVIELYCHLNQAHEALNLMENDTDE
ncbi:MAG: DUF2007 domain-containing protein [Bacteroidota bacterium]|nr:DUF2007 domain-containing protein [Bacteroidota bacterium]MDX5430791.1 DUF2007 domain-containing protein [Bacteroidota bacterium]MDX5469536.1 DUF2007 domain-containing protein [Bacteroidota bacterium]